MITNELYNTLTRLGERRLDLYLHRPTKRRPLPALERVMLHCVDATLVTKHRGRIDVYVMIAAVLCEARSAIFFQPQTCSRL